MKNPQPIGTDLVQRKRNAFANATGARQASFCLVCGPIL